MAVEQSGRSSHPPAVDLRLRVALIFTLVVWMSWLTRHWLLDDALIYARYFSHALHGRGLTFNDGENINALTSVLYGWIVLGVSILARGHILLIEAVLSASFLFLALAGAEAFVPFSGIVLAAGSYLYLCKGMETSLFLLMLFLTARAYTDRNTDWIPFLCALSCFTRFEGGALLVVVAWRCWQDKLRPRAVSYIAPVLVAACYLVFNLHFYHHLLPQSASAKLGQGRSGFWGPWPTAFLHVPEMVVKPIGGSLVFFAVLAAIVWLNRKDPFLARWNRVVLPFLLILATFYILGNIPNYHWYYAPFVFFLTINAVKAIPQTRPVMVACGLILLVMIREDALDLHHLDKQAYLPYDSVALWLQTHTPPSVRVASVETGHIGWGADRNLIDIVGLTTPKNGVYTSHRDFTSWFNDRPDYIIVHPSVNFPWEKVALESPEYEMLPVHFADVSLLHRKNAAPPLDPPSDGQAAHAP